MLEVRQEEVKQFPACIECWNETIERGIEIMGASPIGVARQQRGGGEEE